MHNCQTCEGLSDDCFHARCDSVVHALCYAECVVYQRAEVLSLPEQPVLVERVQRFLCDTIHWAFCNLLREGANHQEQVLANSFLCKIRNRNSVCQERS